NRLAYDHAANVAHECIRHCGANTTADTGPANQQCVNGEHAEEELEVGTEEGARPPLADDAIARLGRHLGNDRRALAAVDLEPAPGVVALLVAPQSGGRADGRNQALGVEHRQTARASTRAELSDRLVGFADRWPQRGGRLRIAEVVLHVDDQY